MTIHEILDGIGIHYITSGHHHCRPGWIQLDCPFCGDGSRKYHLGWNISANYANCWRCGAHHAYKVLTALGLPPGHAKNAFNSLESISIPQPREIRGKLKEPEGRGPLLKPHRRYLRSRGFHPERIIHLWRVEGIGIHGRLPWRIYIPIYRDSARVGWTTRAIRDNGVRYLSAAAHEEIQSPKSLIYGADYCRHSIVIVEGPLDAWRIGPGAGALSGIGYSTSQVLRLSEIPYRYICFDSSQDAQKQARKLAAELSVFPGETHVVELDAEDPGSASIREVKRLRKVARL